VEYRDDDALVVNAVMKPRSAYVILVTDSHAQLAATPVRRSLLVALRHFQSCSFGHFWKICKRAS